MDPRARLLSLRKFHPLYGTKKATGTSSPGRMVRMKVH